VADASAIGLPVYAPDAEDIADGEWVQIDGAFEAGDFRGDQVPILQPTTLVVVEQPEHPYLYP
jgi:putative membrane protein